MAAEDFFAGLLAFLLLGLLIFISSCGFGGMRPKAAMSLDVPSGIFGAMEPAFSLVMDDARHAKLGELTVILGQVDEILIRTVQNLLKLDRQAANLVMGSSKVADNAGIWSEVIRNHTKDPDLLWLVTHALSEINAVSADRNDFVHAWYERSLGAWGGRFLGWASGVWGGGRIVSRRVRNTKHRLVVEIDGVRDRAARLSCLAAHIDHLIQGKSEPSPWLERLAPSLPPRPPQGEVPRRGKGRRGQHGSSRP